MAQHDYHVISRWTVDGTLEEVADIFLDTQSLPEWWPAVFLDSETIRAGGEAGLDRTVRLRTKGWLPYTLDLSFVVTDVTYPARFVLVVHGDFEGRCICRGHDLGSHAEVVFDWQVEVVKPLVRLLSPILKRAFIANHVWVMARGQESMRIEIPRRRAIKAGRAIDRIAPPGPTFPHNRSCRPTVDRLSRVWGASRRARMMEKV